MTCTDPKAAGMNKRVKILGSTAWCIGKVFCLLPFDCTAYLLLNVFYSLTWMLQTLSLQYFFDAIQLAGEGKNSLNTLLAALAFMGISFLVYHVLDGVSNCYSEVIVLKIRHSMQQLLAERIAEVKLQDFEDVEKLEWMEKAKNGANQVHSYFLTVMDTLGYYVPYFIFMAIYFMKESPELTGIIAIAFIPALLSRFASSVQYKKLEDQDAFWRRKQECYEACLTEKDNIRDTRILGASGYFENLYRNSLQEQYWIRKKITLRENFKQGLLQFVAACGYGATIWILFVSVVDGRITVGTFAAVIATVANLFRFMNKMVVERIGSATQNIGTIENFIEFVKAYAKKKADQKRSETLDGVPESQDVVLEHVSFRYPNAEKEALSDISLRIKAGETVAVVGENGSGKSTLSKLILGLYEPTSGSVLYGNQPAADRKDNASAVFQKMHKYKLSLQDNITVSNEFAVEEKRLKKASDDSDVSQLLHEGKVTMETILDREFGGTELSGGQWQRVVIGRGIYKKHELIVLDEPTAAIDPIEETKIYHRFAKICKEKTAVLITHRLGAVKLVDRILVMRNGKLVEEGSYEALMQKNGYFRMLYDSQKEWYVEN